MSIAILDAAAVRMNCLRLHVGLVDFESRLHASDAYPVDFENAGGEW